jgi:3-dehydroquinate synthase
LIEKGLITSVGTHIKELLGEPKLCIVTDDTVDALYAKNVEESLALQGLSFTKFVIPHGEASKNANNLIALLEFLASNRMTRSDALIALGGGVVGDLAGFAAGVYLRGVKFIQIPTTLLAAVDSSVGGKTAIDLEAGKNLAGVFHQPSLVLCDPDTLNTLSSEIFADGCAEVIKYGIINDRELFDILKGDIKANIELIIERCVTNKARIVELDEFDLGMRQLLNLGHTIGHAIESKEGLSGMLHGECVGIGMLPFCSQNVRTRVEALLKKMSVKTVYDGDRYALTSYIRYDKKRAYDRISVVVCNEIGSYEIKQMNLEEVITRCMLAANLVINGKSNKLTVESNCFDRNQVC